MISGSGAVVRRRGTVRLQLGVLMVTVCVPGIGAQEVSTADTTAFMASAREAASRYLDRNEAILDGYRRLGPDFPGMGEHWVSPARIVSGDLDPREPASLSYVVVEGSPQLVGLAYAVPLRGDELPPVGPFEREAWHDHTGAILEESLLLEHPSSVSHEPSEFRLSMLHLWVPLDNPGGALDQNNWKLPFLRAGLSPPGAPSSRAGRGLSLGTGSVGYYRRLIGWATDMGPTEEVELNRILDRYALSVDGWANARRGRPLTDSELRELEAFWNGFWAELEASISADSFDRIHALRAESH